MGLNRAQKSLVGAAALALALESLPVGRMLLLPLAYLNTHVHELGHALAALASGGNAGPIVVRTDGSGTTPVTGGWLPLIAASGYVGSTVAGGLAIGLGGKPDRARTVLVALGLVLLVTQIGFVRGDLVGVISGWVWAIVLLALGRSVRGSATVFVTQFLGLVLCLASWKSFVALFHVGIEGHSDATLMANATGIPAGFWATSWFGVSVGVVGLALWRAWR